MNLIIHIQEKDYLTSILFFLGCVSPFIGVATAYLNIGDAFTNIIISLMVMFVLLWNWAMRMLG